MTIRVIEIKITTTTTRTEGINIHPISESSEVQGEGLQQHTVSGQYLNHPEYITFYHEKDPNLISEGILRIIQDSFDPIATVRRIPLTNKNANKVLEEARELLTHRYAAHDRFKDI